jgi:RNA polymerase sigma factor (sigma-70 family)
MTVATAAYDLDLSRMGDEVLAVLVQDCDYHPALWELVLRYQALLTRWIYRLARRAGLTGADVEDARQEMEFALHGAALDYDTGQLGRRDGCPFRTFARRRVANRFYNFVKGRRRAESHYQRSVDVYRLPVVCRDPGATLAVLPEETRAAIAAAVRGLPETERTVWELWAGGMQLKQIGRSRRIAYRTVKRRWQRVRATLAACLRGFFD